MTSLKALRTAIRELHHLPEGEALDSLVRDSGPTAETRALGGKSAEDLIRRIRADGTPGLMEVFLAEYGLSTDEGVALMCLAEALLRVPDRETIDDLIEDKIAPSAWGEHLGASASSLVNASTWALMLTGRVLKDGDGTGVASVLHGVVKRLGEPVIRTAVQRAMKELGAQFVLGRTIDEAWARGKKRMGEGYTYSFDMLGEAALTQKDAEHYAAAYEAAIARLAKHSASSDIRENPGISIKLSAIHPRYEVSQRERVMTELVATTTRLARQAKAGGMGLNIDAEEADRLDLSLDVIEAVLRDPELAGWDGFGVVVQAYGKRAPLVLDWLYALAQDVDRKIMVRLVKGAYWDTEIKRAHVGGLTEFPVYTRKAATDASYLCCANKLLGMTDRVYPQFATHNAHTMASILEMTKDRRGFEFQRLHGMGTVLHQMVMKDSGTRCRIYAPVGAHRDLLAYLVRRLLENGANSSFVNQIVDEDVPASVVAADPFAALASAKGVVAPRDLFAPSRVNSRGYDLFDETDMATIDAARAPFTRHKWSVGPVLAKGEPKGPMHEVINPANPSDVVGSVQFATVSEAGVALVAAQQWNVPAEKRAQILNKAADLYEEHFGEFFAVLAREAGKTLADAMSELREAVDFLRYYASEGLALQAPARGIITCISPWNFPLAIFTGQVAAALAAGNAVVAKPAETTTITACIAARLLHEAGVPREVLQIVPGRGAEVGPVLTGDAKLGGVCFTGSTATAQRINRAMAEGAAPDAVLVAETGGLNAMIVDSTALPEQAIKDIVASAFQSAGQRCSALRMLYLQEDIADGFLKMLAGAMDQLKLGQPWDLATDIGPVIDETARAGIVAHIDLARSENRVTKELDVPAKGTFVSPVVIRVGGIADLEREIFGPVLHVATFKAEALDRVVDAINATGYGLTFGMHSRIDNRVEQVTARLNVGNIYINRNQIGAVVGSQPFGGEGLSGTGPKAGGPAYVPRFVASTVVHNGTPEGKALETATVQRALNAVRRLDTVLQSHDLPGPTGESNRLSVVGRGTVLCLGPTLKDAQEQARIARENGCGAVVSVPGATGPDSLDGLLDRAALADLSGIAVVALWSDAEDQRVARRHLAARSGAIIPLVCSKDLAQYCHMERHVCINTTAAGGNTELLAGNA